MGEIFCKCHFDIVGSILSHGSWLERRDKKDRTKGAEARSDRRPQLATCDCSKLPAVALQP